MQYGENKYVSNITKFNLRFVQYSGISDKFMMKSRANTRV